MTDPKVYKELGLTDQEYQRIEKILGREPSSTELAMFSVEWSEHCGYPRSKKLLKLFPQTGAYETLVGEDSGGFVIDDIAVIFKMESHNHPSQVEPRQGAATGVGGIIRDIFTTGARPIASMDSLRFGELKDPLSRYLLSGVVDGIAFYGNCLGVPTVGGEIYFDEAYSGNCLVNAMSLGIVEKGKIAKARATGPGNSIIYVGSSTGRDGIGGCSILASHEFAECEEKRPTVQIGDPFTEKCLIEATLEALETGHILGIKDMGAAGLTCSTSEMAAAGGVGMDVILDKVPRREQNMEPFEVMMSESQERMLACVKQGKEEEVRKIFLKWGLQAEVIGRVTDDGMIRIRDKGKVVAEINVSELATPPIYDMPYSEPDYIKLVRDFNIREIREPGNLNEVILKLLSSPNIASKSWVYEQYDHMVQVGTATLPGGDSAVIRLPGKKFGLAMTTDCNGLYCYLNPKRGAEIAVAEAARNLACSGAHPAAVTDCLNFGNPEKPDRYWQFKNSVEGIVEACKFFNVAVVSGNVSFYNESPKGAIYPTPTIGMVGVVKDIEKRATIEFKNEGDIIVLLGTTKDELGGSEYLKVVHGLVKGDAPELDLDLELAVGKTCIEGIEKGIAGSAHDCSEGGIAVALAESSIKSGKGALISFSSSLRGDSLLFSESQSRIVITVSPLNLEKIKDIARKYNAPVEVIGKVSGDKLVIRNGKRTLIDKNVKILKEAYDLAIPKALGVVK
ncbi:MAG: phosphoribosylformylglycinamidine synthase subunit PurL [Candidatus Saganbacteria bacterium]|nr:phosphoribosylformylglycinamidine synthase subunit PurL [Candidatus Saganbacteria bacterium]